MKYIDAEKITRLLDAKYKDFMGKAKTKGYTTLQYQYMADGIDIAEQLIDSLQQEQQEKKEVKFVFPKFLYARTTNNKTIDVSYAPQSLDAIEYIRSDSLQQEQPDEPVTDYHDLKEAAKEFANQDCVTFISRKNGFKAGAEWQKAKMMEGAVEGFVGVHLHDKRADVTVNSGYLPKEMGIKSDSKVKIIIVKEDNNGH